VVEGSCLRSTKPQQRLGGGVGVAEHVFRWNAENFDVGGSEPLGSNFISRGPITTIMRLAVDFDRKPGSGAVEI